MMSRTCLQCNYNVHDVFIENHLNLKKLDLKSNLNVEIFFNRIIFLEKAETERKARRVLNKYCGPCLIE